jgi:hypothetical protein
MWRTILRKILFSMALWCLVIMRMSSIEKNTHLVWTYQTGK